MLVCLLREDTARWDNPIITDAEAMDVAAFINDDQLHERVRPILTKEYPALKEKPVDYYWPPFADGFTQGQHKYGPFKPIIAWRNDNGQPTGY